MKKVYRVYEVIDEETGEILPKEKRINYKTIRNEISRRTEGDYEIETTRRIVRHNGQQCLEI